MVSTVIVLNDFCYVQGGASKVAIDEAVALARSGLNVVFLGAVGPPAVELASAPLTVECLGQHELLDGGRHPGVAIQGLWNAAAARRTRQILAGLSRTQTVVHLHGYTKALSTSPIAAAHRLGFPMICTLHDFFAACPNGAFFDYSSQTPCRRQALSADCLVANCDKRRYAHKLYRFVRTAAQRGLGHFPRGIQDYVALSEGSIRVLAPYLPPETRFHRLPNLVDAMRQPAAHPDHSRTILYVGRLDAEKGVGLLAQAVGRLGLECIMVGDGPLRDEMAKMPGTTVTGWVAHEEVGRYLRRARCIVFPSLWYETFGLVTSEAAACGVPAIVSSTCAAAERIEDGVTGWRFRSGDVDDLARCLRLVADDGVARDAGLAAYRAHWADAATPETHARRLIAIYEAMLRERAATAVRTAGTAPSDRDSEANRSSLGG